jgi:hypothetical protein
LSLERSKYACHDTRSYTRAACSPHTHTHIHTQTYTHAHTHRDVDADAKGQCSPINRRQRRQRDSTATRVRVRVGGWSGRWGGGLLMPMHAPLDQGKVPRGPPSSNPSQVVHSPRTHWRTSQGLGPPHPS